MPIDETEEHWIAVDWGTTNFRAFLIDTNGHIYSKIEADMGLLSVHSNDFAEALALVLKEKITNFESYPIVMAGMVGSSLGWYEVPYIKAPASVDNLKEGVYKFQLPWGSDAFILPGVSYTDEKIIDVMRGEEIQAIGLLELFDTEIDLAIFPGTHSKHVNFNSKQIQSVQTFMTGEIYSLLLNHSLLGKNIAHTNNYYQKAFLDGVKLSQLEPLSHIIFQARTKYLFDELAESEISDFLSGLCIGYELQNISSSMIFIVGNDVLAERYGDASELLGLRYEVIDGNHCFVSGIKSLTSFLF